MTAHDELVRPAPTVPAARDAEQPTEFLSGFGQTARTRVIFGAICLLLLIAGAAGWWLGVEWLRLVGIGSFCIIGIGAAPWQLNYRVGLAGRLAFSLLTSVSMLILVSTAMVLAGAWYPTAAFLVTVAVCVPLHLLGLGQAVKDWQVAVRARRLHAHAQLLRGVRADASTNPVRSGVARPWYRSWAPLLAAIAGGAACGISAVTHQHLDPQFGGFFAQVGPLWFVGLLLILMSFTLADGDNEWQMAISAVLLILALTLTPSIIYDGPRSQSAFKHVDLVQQIRTLHTVDSSVSVYNDWPGFFACIAWLCDLMGIKDPMVLARFWPAVIGLFRVTALRYLFGKMLVKRYRIWLAVGLAILADPLNADYFSPQSLGFVMGVAMFGLALPAQSGAVTGVTGRRQRPRIDTSATPWREIMILASGCAVAVTHQLSPYIIGGALVVLVVFRQVRPWWIPALVLVPAVLWALLHFQDIRAFISLSQIGEPSNFLPPTTEVSPGLSRLPIVGYVTAALIGCIAIVGLLAVAALFRRRFDLQSWAVAVAAGVGLFFVFVNAYGREGIFRAILFAIPWLVLLAAQVLRPRSTVVKRLPALAVAVILSCFFYVASFGLDRINVVNTADVDAYQFYVHQGPDQSGRYHYLVTLGQGDLPFAVPRINSTHQFLSTNRLKSPAAAGQPAEPLAQTAPALTAALLRFSHQPAYRAQLYVFWSPTSANYQRAYGIQTPERFAELRDEFAAATYWHVVFSEQGRVVFRFDGSQYSAVTP